MDKQRKNSYAHTSAQVDRARRIYSQIGEPLPADVIIDLHLHLGRALELNQENEYAPRRDERKAKACLN